MQNISVTYHAMQQFVDLCFCTHEVLLNSKLNYIDLHFALANKKFTVQSISPHKNEYDPCPLKYKSINV